MGFRDEGEAARARAEALERELEATQARLAEAEEELAEAKAALEVGEREAADLEEKRRRKKGEKKKARARAEESLEALREEGLRPSPEPAPPPRPDEDAERELRILRSTSMFAESELWTWGIVFGLPGFYFSIWLMIQLDGKPYGILIGFGLVAALAWLAWKASLAWARRQPEAEARWARGRPFKVRGYPELLGAKPRERFSHGKGHQTLRVELRFAGAPPPDLDRILRGFDKELKAMGRKEPCFERPSPLTTQRSRGGTVWHVDSNEAVVRWVRRFDDKVLLPLHHAHGLERVRYELL